VIFSRPLATLGGGGGVGQLFCTAMEASLKVCISCATSLHPLHGACKAGHGECTRGLLASGYCVDVRNFGNTTALVEACRRGHAECVRLLLDAGASVDDVGGTCGYEMTALMHAVGIYDTQQVTSPPDWSRHDECARLLIEAGAPVDAKGGICGSTALTIACENGRTGAVRLLLENGARVDATGVRADDDDEQTALKNACRFGYCECVCMLLQFGARIDVSVRNWFLANGAHLRFRLSNWKTSRAMRIKRVLGTAAAASAYDALVRILRRRRGAPTQSHFQTVDAILLRTLVTFHTAWRCCILQTAVRERLFTNAHDDTIATAAAVAAATRGWAQRRRAAAYRIAQPLSDDMHGPIVIDATRDSNARPPVMSSGGT